MNKSFPTFLLALLCTVFADRASAYDDSRTLDGDRVVISQSACLSTKQLSVMQNSASKSGGDLQAARALARHFSECDEDGEEMSLEYSRKAATFGFAEDVWNFGAALDDSGQHEQAFPLILQSAKQGNQLAVRRVADAYLTGVGTAKNELEAQFWLENAARHCDSESALRLSELAAGGEQKRLVRPLVWALVSEGQRNSEQAKRLISLYTAALSADDQKLAQDSAERVLAAQKCD